MGAESGVLLSPLSALETGLIREPGVLWNQNRKPDLDLMRSDRLWKPFVIPQNVSRIHGTLSSFSAINPITVRRLGMDPVFTSIALAYGASRADIQPCWFVRSTCTRAHLQIPSSSLHICLLEDILPHWKECVMLPL